MALLLGLGIFLYIWIRCSIEDAAVREKAKNHVFKYSNIYREREIQNQLYDEETKLGTEVFIAKYAPDSLDPYFWQDGTFIDWTFCSWKAGRLVEEEGYLAHN